MNVLYFLQISNQIMGTNFDKSLSMDLKSFHLRRLEHRLGLDPIDFQSKFIHKRWGAGQQKLEPGKRFSRILCLNQQTRLVSMFCRKCW